MDQHTGGEWLIHGTKCHKDNQLQSPVFPKDILYDWKIPHVSCSNRQDLRRKVDVDKVVFFSYTANSAVKVWMFPFWFVKNMPLFFDLLDSLYYELWVIVYDIYPKNVTLR